MEPKILRYVLMLANEKNFSKAAKKLHLSQPSLSYQIAKLEKELGVLLFNRGKGKIHLTFAGEKFVERTIKIIDELEQLRNEMLDVAEMKKGQLIIGSLATTGAYLLPNTIAIFKEKYPGIELVLLEDTTTNLELLVSRGEVEISLLSMPVENTELEVETILEEDILLAVPNSHRLANHREINLSDCSEDHFILTKQENGFRKTTENLCHKAGFEPKVIFESINIHTCQSLVLSGMGITFVPSMILDDNKFLNTLKYLPIKKPAYPKRNVVFAYKNGRYLSKAARAFIDIMKKLTE
ncbi:hypothetical protein BTR23_12320 [Alkalihalophilus pseudofirmus]|nr:hypothetical protein BTR23_12320 [Alkalihalophilus pseudofirmus]